MHLRVWRANEWTPRIQSNTPTNDLAHLGQKIGVPNVGSFFVCTLVAVFEATAIVYGVPSDADQFYAHGLGVSLS